MSVGTLEPAWGAQVQPDGSVCFRTWAPSHLQLAVRIAGSADLSMRQTDNGWHELTTDCAEHGSRYEFVLPDGSTVPDPASFHQPLGVAGPSAVVDFRRLRWTQEDWKGRPWHEAVIYELHVGSFTSGGTYRAAIARLPHLAALGVTAIELMPIGSFAGARNWGYDGVLPFAPASVYGTPEDLNALVDAAQNSGLMVLLDVVYNHFGPEGNALPRLAPAFYTKQHKTPWGAGFDFSHERAVRAFFIQNALHWLTHYRFDGLRLDAVHAIADDSTPTVVEELAATVRDQLPTRHAHLIVENECNESHLLERNGARPRYFDAQWNDDLHHALHVAVTGETDGYYADYAGDSAKLARAIAQGFSYQGEYMAYRGSARGEPSAQLPPLAFIGFIQNHDQVGNRALGERLSALAPAPAVRAAGAIYLLMPQVPMLFMGEEWGSAQPFPFFCDFGGELGRAVTDGRHAEFARFPAFASQAAQARIPDPLHVDTFNSAKLDWQALDDPAHREILGWYTRILAVRRREIIPRLPDIVSGGCHFVFPSGAIRVDWTAGGERLFLSANLSAATVSAEQVVGARTLWQEGTRTDKTMGPWCVQWCLAAAV